MLNKGDVITLTDSAQENIEQIGYVDHATMTPHSVKPMEYVVVGHDGNDDPYVINRELFKPEMLEYTGKQRDELIYRHPATFWVEPCEIATVNGVTK